MANNNTRHHICPTSRGGSRKDERNIVRLIGNFHVAWHQIFFNMLPHEQVGRIMDVNTNALREEFRKDVAAILDKGDDYFYKNGVLRRK